MPFRVCYPALSIFVMVGALTAATPPAALAATLVRADTAVTRYRTASIDGIDIFYREVFRSRRPPTPIVWGKHDLIFPADGHFALEDKGDEIATLMLDFLDRKLTRK